MLYQETEKYKLKKDYEGIADDLRTNSERIKEVVENFELFQFDDTCFWSETVLKRVKSREEKSESARKSAEARWSKSGKGKNANALRGKKPAMLKRRGEEKREEEKNIEHIFFENEKFSKTWNSYLAMRKEIKKPLTDQPLALKKLEGLCKNDVSLGIKIVEQSIMGSWQGLFPLKEEEKKENPFAGIRKL